MSTMSAKTPFTQRLNALIQGVENTLPSTATLVVNQKSLKQAALLSALEAQAAPFDAVEAAQAQVTKLLAERAVAEPGATSLYKQVVSALLGYYGTDTAALAEFGIAPRKARRQLTGPELVASAAKAQATRDLRGTKGSREKLKVKATGDFIVSVGAPPTASAASPSAPASNPVAAPTPVATPLPAPVAVVVTASSPSSSASTAVNGVATNGAVAPMLMNGAGH